MSNTILTHDAGVSAFEDAGGVVQTSDDSNVSFNWDEQHIVTVDAPSNLEGAFDTDQFYKVEDATIARPIKQPYMVGDSVEWYKKPAEELDRAAWSFDNAPFTLGHPDTGMVKDVDDIHGFWRKPRYDADDDRLKENLYVPVTDDDAIEWLEDHSDVSVGFYNRVTSDYDGDTGDLTDDEGLDGFQVDMYGNHIAGVENGRCSGEDGCGLDSQDHGTIHTDQTTTFHGEENMSESEAMFSEGDEVGWAADAVVAHNPDDEDGVMVELMDRTGDSTEMVITVNEEDIWHKKNVMRDSTDAHDRDYAIAPPTADYEEDGTYYAVAPDENPDGEPKYPISSCADVDDAMHLSGHGDIDISEETLEEQIMQKARDMGCDVSENSDDCIPCQNNMSEESTEEAESSTDTFDVPDLSVDAVADKNEAVSEVVDERDELREAVDEMETEIRDALDSAEHFSVDLDEDECPCEAVDDLVADLDAKAEEVEELSDELSEYREEEKEEALDTLTDLGADEEEWADEALDAIEEEIDRREEVLEATDADVSVKDIESSTDEGTDNDDHDRTMSGSRTFGRGYGA